MTQEIVFTSSERGLRAGSTGFCTVRSTVGLPPNLASLLEQLTGYTHPYDAYDLSLFDKHPVNFAHYISRVGGQRFHILCRICNAPLDHTNRSNKLAHLIALEEGEIDLTHTQGPASAINWMIPPPGKNQEPGDSRYWITSWPSNREPCVLPDSKRLVLPSVNDKSGPCTVWKQVLGDSGWAAVLAESIQDRKRQTVPVVFSSEQKDKCLDLVQEALSLLSPAERWGVTFSTFQSGSLPTKVECRWQFLLDSTDLAKKALRNQRRTPVIDLTSLKGSKSPASELTAFTNTGKRPWDKVSVSLSQPVAPKQPAPASKQPAPSKKYAEPVLATDDFDDDYDDDGLDSPADGYPLRQRASRRVPRRGKAAPPLRRARKSQSSGRLMAIAGAIIVLGVGAMLIFQGQPPKQQDELIAKSSPRDRKAGRLPDATETTTPVEVAPSAGLPEDAPTDAAENEAVAERAEDMSAEDATEATASSEETKPEVTKPKVTKPKVTKPKSLDDLRKNQNAIAKKVNDPIRKFTESVRKNEIPGSSLPKNNIILSEKIIIESSADCKIVIKSNDALKKAGFDIAVKKEESKWIAFHTVKADLRTHENKIGEFTLEKHKLLFKFDNKLGREDAAMLNAFLETAIIVSHTKGDKDKVTCRLGNPDIKPLLRPEFEFKVAVGVQLLEKSLSENNSKFELDCEIFGLPEDYEPKTNRKFKLSFPAGNNDGSKTFERKFTILKETVSGINIKVSLEADKDNGLVVHCKQILDLMVRKSKYVSEYKSDDFKVEPFTKEMEYVKKHRGPAAKKHSDATKLFGQIEAAHNKDPTDKKKQNAYDAAQNELNELKDDVDRLTGYLDYLNSVEEMRKKLVGEDINGNKKLDALEDGTMVNGVKVMNRKIDPGSIYITYKLRRIGGKDNSKQAIIVTSGGP